VAGNLSGRGGIFPVIGQSMPNDCVISRLDNSFPGIDYYHEKEAESVTKK
jgi:hypothetical protein